MAWSQGYSFRLQSIQKGAWILDSVSCGPGRVGGKVIREGPLSRPQTPELMSPAFNEDLWEQF